MCVSVRFVEWREVAQLFHKSGVISLHFSVFGFALGSLLCACAAAEYERSRVVRCMRTRGAVAAELWATDEAVDEQQPSVGEDDDEADGASRAPLFGVETLERHAAHGQGAVTAVAAASNVVLLGTDAGALIRYDFAEGTATGAPRSFFLFSCSSLLCLSAHSSSTRGCARPPRLRRARAVPGPVGGARARCSARRDHRPRRRRCLRPRFVAFRPAGGEAAGGAGRGAAVRGLAPPRLAHAPAQRRIAGHCKRSAVGGDAVGGGLRREAPRQGAEVHPRHALRRAAPLRARPASGRIPAGHLCIHSQPSVLCGRRAGRSCGWGGERRGAPGRPASRVVSLRAVGHVADGRVGPAGDGGGEARAVEHFVPYFFPSF